MKASYGVSVPVPYPMSSRGLTQLVQVSRHLSVPAADRPGVVAGRHAGVGVPQPPRGDHDAVRVGRPGGVRSPEVVRGDLTEPGRHGNAFAAVCCSTPSSPAGDT